MRGESDRRRGSFLFPFLPPFIPIIICEMKCLALSSFSSFSYFFIIFFFYNIVKGLTNVVGFNP